VPVPGPDKELCGAQLPNQDEGTTCRLVAGYRTDHLGIGRCYRHGGSTPTHVRAAQREIARRECQVLGIEVEIDPGEALIRAVWEAEGNLAFYPPGEVVFHSQPVDPFHETGRVPQRGTR
jgi:hypothetical protein